MILIKTTFHQGNGSIVRKPYTQSLTSLCNLYGVAIYDCFRGLKLRFIRGRREKAYNQKQNRRRHWTWLKEAVRSLSRSFMIDHLSNTSIYPKIF